MVALGLTEAQVASILTLAPTEFEHASFLLSVLATSGAKPVQPCTYTFGPAVTDAATFLATASILESVGVSAYLGAAPLIADSSILAAAAAITTVEGRHQTLIRSVTSPAVAVASAFDAALGPRHIFSLAAPFIASCPEGSLLAITPFPSLAMVDAAATTVPGQLVKLTSDVQQGATFCGFTSGDARPGGTQFAPFDQATGCIVPNPARGVVYVTLTNAAPLDGILTDQITVAGPIVMVVS